MGATTLMDGELKMALGPQVLSESLPQVEVSQHPLVLSIGLGICYACVED